MDKERLLNELEALLDSDDGLRAKLESLVIEKKVTELAVDLRDRLEGFLQNTVTVLGLNPPLKATVILNEDGQISVSVSLLTPKPKQPSSTSDAADWKKLASELIERGMIKAKKAVEYSTAFRRSVTSVVKKKGYPVEGTLTIEEDSEWARKLLAS